MQLVADGETVPSGGTLERRLGVADAVVIGAGSMIGAGVFAAWSPAAGTGLIIGLVIAGVVAFCNAASSAQLAAIRTTNVQRDEYQRVPTSADERLVSSAIQAF